MELSGIICDPINVFREGRKVGTVRPTQPIFLGTQMLDVSQQGCPKEYVEGQCSWQVEGFFKGDISPDDLGKIFDVEIVTQKGKSCGKARLREISRMWAPGKDDVMVNYRGVNELTGDLRSILE